MELFVSEASGSGIASSKVSPNDILYVVGKDIGSKSSKIADKLRDSTIRIKYPQTLLDISPQQAREVKYIIIEGHGITINKRSTLFLTGNPIFIEDLIKDLIDQFPHLECLEIYACHIGDKKALEEYYNIYDLNKDDDRKFIQAKNEKNTKTRDIPVIYNAGAKKEFIHNNQSRIVKSLPLIKSQPLKFKEIFLSKLFYPQRAVLTFKNNAYRFGRLKVRNDEDIEDISNEAITTHIRNTIYNFIDKWNQNNQDNQISNSESFATSLSEKILGFNIFVEGISDEHKTQREEYFHQYRRANFLTKFERNSIKSKDEITKCLELYKKHNIRVNEKDEFGWTALHIAAHNAHGGIVAKLLEEGADIKAETYDGLTALHTAAQHEHGGIVAKLLKEGADIEATTNNDWTALHIAARNGHGGIVEKLLEEGADIKAETYDGLTALHIAARYGHVEIVEKLLKEGDTIEAARNNGWTALHVAAQYGHRGIVEKLLERKPDLINATTNNGWTALHIAAQYGHVEVVEKLLEKRANIEARMNNGWTALHIAAQYGHVEIVEKLLEKKPDLINTKINGDYTALHIAAQYGHVEVVEKLLEKEANIKAVTNDGLTALHSAARNGHVEVVEKLLEKQPDLIEATTNDGLTALQIAERNGKIDVKELLENYRKPLPSISKAQTTALIPEPENKINVCNIAA